MSGWMILQLSGQELEYKRKTIEPVFNEFPLDLTKLWKEERSNPVLPFLHSGSLIWNLFLYVHSFRHLNALALSVLSLDKLEIIYYITLVWPLNSLPNSLSRPLGLFPFPAPLIFLSKFRRQYVVITESPRFSQVLKERPMHRGTHNYATQLVSLTFYLIALFYL